MKETAIHISLLTKQEDELSTQELRLLNEARLATYRSYAPYSHFSVGAAVELADGTIVSGSNQENAVQSVQLCSMQIRATLMCPSVASALWHVAQMENLCTVPSLRVVPAVKCCSKPNSELDIPSK